jgi:metallo-beta-lactamase family protein
LRQKEIKDLKIFVDSSLTIKVTNIFKNHEECFDKETKDRYKFTELFENKNIFYTKSVAQSKKINEEKNSCIIISSS